MLNSTKPHSSPPRATRTPQPPPISYPLAASRPTSQATVLATPLSPKKIPPHARKPSLSNTMHWLSRTSTQSSSSPYAPSKPTRISEPKLIRSIDLVSHTRSGTLGSGATIVRTPDEALRETGVRLTHDGKARDPSASPGATRSRSSISSEKAPSLDNITPPTSPPLPPLPLSGDTETDIRDVGTSEAPRQPRPTRAPPAAPLLTPSPVHSPPNSPPLRPSLKMKSSQNTEEGHLPPMPTNNFPYPAPPAFRPILVSEIPTGAVDPSKIIVTLETSTAAHKTTLETLRSRPSHLSEYLSFIFPSEQGSTTSSIYSVESDDHMSTYRHHLTSQGLLPQASFSIHIFLDRPSNPYTHILNYLRSPVASLEAPETLPRSILMHSSSNTRLECLLELRDEAAYLNLEPLQKLCTDEIRMRNGPRLHMRGYSSSTAASAQSLHASVYSLHTLLERVESDIRSNPRDSNGSDGKSTKCSPADTAPSRSLIPTPQSWKGNPRGRSEGRYSLVRSPPEAPTGWI
ncbi:hypothetical protein H0H81_001290 [Sphagnurus paluster]|uniref:Uncharacterized protein n=1 Tax=Sphagnurus paluster TaxID=117069 RepID=A0A9P7FXJ9_9AGAR|nr:hypothetical protein H0H81_001290 [Sphagnurus paluster]